MRNRHYYIDPRRVILRVCAYCELNRLILKISFNYYVSPSRCPKSHTIRVQYMIAHNSLLGQGE